MDTKNESCENLKSNINISDVNQKAREDEGILILEKKNNNFGPGSARSKKKWTDIEDKLLLEIVSNKKEKKKWKEISSFFKNKSAIQCRSRWERIKPGIKSGRWTKEEDELLEQLYNQHGIKWSNIAKRMNNRTGKQIRERCNILLDRRERREKIRKEDKLKLIKLYNQIGPNWILIRSYFNYKYNAETLKNAFYAYYRRKEKYGQVIIKYTGEVDNKKKNSSSSSKDAIKTEIPSNQSENLNIEEIKVKIPGSFDSVLSNNLERKETMQSSECISEINSRKDQKAKSIPHSQLNQSASLDSSTVLPGNDCNIFNNICSDEQLKYLQGYFAIEMQKRNFLNSYNNYIRSASMFQNLDNLNAIIQTYMALSRNQIYMNSLYEK